MALYRPLIQRYKKQLFYDYSLPMSLVVAALSQSPELKGVLYFLVKTILVEIQNLKPVNDTSHSVFYERKWYS